MAIPWTGFFPAPAAPPAPAPAVPPPPAHIDFPPGIDSLFTWGETACAWSSCYRERSYSWAYLNANREWMERQAARLLEPNPPAGMKDFLKYCACRDHVKLPPPDWLPDSVELRRFSTLKYVMY